MIPIRDLNPTTVRPVVTWTLIAMNVAVYVYATFFSSPMILAPQYGVIPFELVGDPSAVRALTIVTSMFLHGGLMHAAGNMWFLYVFGDNVEEALGQVRYVALYFLAGLGAVALQVATDPGSKIPMIGASGAIAGVLGAYMLLYPRAKVLTLLPILVIFTFVEIRAFWFLFLWFGYQLVLGSLTLGEEGGGVAFWAHIGGFIVGAVLAFPLRRRSQTTSAAQFPAHRSDERERMKLA